MYSPARNDEEKLSQASEAIGLFMKARQDAPSAAPACGAQSSFIMSQGRLINPSTGQLDTTVASEGLRTLAVTGINPKWHDPYAYGPRGPLANTGELLVSEDPMKSKIAE